MSNKTTMSPTTKKIALKHAFPWEGKQVTHLTLRAPKVKDMLAAVRIADNEAEQEVAMFANLGEVVPEMIHEIHLVEYIQQQEAYMDFLC